MLIVQQANDLQMQSVSDTISEALIISNWYKHIVMGRKWIGHARLLAEVPSTSIEYCVLLFGERSRMLRTNVTCVPLQ